MITLTESAKDYLTTTTKKNGKKYAYLGVLGGGCSGFQYEWSMTDETDKGTLLEDILILDKDGNTHWWPSHRWRPLNTFKKSLDILGRLA